MKLNRTFFIGFIAIASLASCVSEDLKTLEDKAEKGRMKLDVSILQPQATRANSEYTEAQLAQLEKANNYPVIIYNSDNVVEKKYDHASDFPTTGLVLAVGNYSVVSHTPGDVEKKMTKPYYQGTEPMEIKKGIDTEVDVVCKMLNSKIQVTYSEAFLALFSAWTITIDDGSETALSFTNADGNTPAPVYWLFQGDVPQLTVTFRATRKSDNATVTDRGVLDKSQISTKYVNDNPNFCGGDVLNINFDPTEATTGTVTGVTISATVTFDSNTTEKTETLNITDNKLNPDEGGNDNPNPGGDDVLPSMTATDNALETGVSYSISAGNWPATVITIKTPKGCKSVHVYITGGNGGFQEACEEVHMNDAELVGNAILPAVLAGVGVSLPMPKAGDTTYDFPVGNFYSMMNMYGATGVADEDGTPRPPYHTFRMVVTDNEDNVKEASLNVTITD